MPQLDTSTWLITIFSMILTLFIMMQLKVSKHSFHSNPEPLEVKSSKHTTPWETKWTKIYSPLSLPQR
uniref:ATP synthase complex subunit 8 n=3 Tax=Rhinolophus TaxID=49442 RepID=A0A6B9WCZ1_RHIPS|nr:ATP synthase F0 subunit 8 [Rhinolophus monoceros]YP_009353899.1 ATP synthase F0 subunit 8 [Rhinolophus thomasi]YP_009731384.1 ATP synthase F0 subunit 8 [Rhinolophus pusillus]YP_010322021.1 ATP synthase F0 subunit 8 [Rhinolophus huananus]YP_010322060.1 ATP synthase F0 subunit 8 [Rhinolophus siamensis]UKP81725.1 ATP synthase F0 subunit 8 [Rhinolophus cf. macrotis sensu Tu et al. 2017]UKP81738.1 ATP synthase F0 subunit 8 [Rhinolophus cf. siamensis sensu Tu et al. 2017]AAK97513.1 ATPase 8 [Rh